jgi:hypothetical protein
MRRWILNVWLLGAKELRSLMKDVTLVLLIVFAFTGAIVVVANGVKAEVSTPRSRSSTTIAPNFRASCAMRCERPISSRPKTSPAPMWRRRWTPAAISS